MDFSLVEKNRILLFNRVHRRKNPIIQIVKIARGRVGVRLPKMYQSIELQFSSREHFSIVDHSYIFEMWITWIFHTKLLWLHVLGHFYYWEVNITFLKIFEKHILHNVQALALIWQQKEAMFTSKHLFNLRSPNRNCNYSHNSSKKHHKLTQK